MQKFFLLIVTTFITINIFAQQNDHSLNQEDSKYENRNNHSSEYSHKKPQQIPSWILHPPAPNPGEVIAFGISDPGLDSTDAMQMAIYRAQIMAYTLENSTTKFMVDFFTNEITGAQEVVYEHFARTITKMPKNVKHCKVINTYTNDFDETYVLVKYKPTRHNSKKQYLVFLELFKNELEAGGRGEFESVYELIVKDITDKRKVPMMYRIIEFGNRGDVEGTFYNQDYGVPIYSLKYRQQLSDTVIKKQFSHGIWKEMFKSTLTQILNNARTKPETIKDMGDNYQTSSSEKLTRGISSNSMSFIWLGAEFKNEEIQVKLKDVPLK